MDVQVVGPLRNLAKNHVIAEQISKRIERIPGAADVHIHQVNDVPMISLDVDRARAGQLGFTQLDVASGLLISLSSSSQLNPNWWVNPANGVDYPVVVQTPTYRMDTPGAILNTPIHSGAGDTQLLEQHGAGRAPRDHAGGESLQRAAALRHLRQRAGSRPGRRRERSGQSSGGVRAASFPPAAFSKRAGRWAPCAHRSRAWRTA